MSITPKNQSYQNKIQSAANSAGKGKTQKGWRGQESFLSTEKKLQLKKKDVQRILYLAEN